MDKRRLQINKILEYFWLAIAIIATAGMAHSYYIGGYSKNTIIFNIMIFVAFFMFRVKRKLRKTIEQTNKKQSNDD